MMRAQYKNSALALVMGLFLVACGGNNFTDLDEFMDEKRSRPGGIIPPIPAFKAYKAFTYSATSLRSPFDRPIEIREISQLQAQSTVEPDETRPKEFHELHEVDDHTRAITRLHDYNARRVSVRQCKFLPLQGATRIGQVHCDAGRLFDGV